MGTVFLDRMKSFESLTYLENTRATGPDRRTTDDLRLGSAYRFCPMCGGPLACAASGPASTAPAVGLCFVFFLDPKVATAPSSP